MVAVAKPLANTFTQEVMPPLVPGTATKFGTELVGAGREPVAASNVFVVCSALLTFGRTRAVNGWEPALIAVTGYGQETDRERSRQAGFVAHLVKPVDPDHLKQVIDDLTAAAPSGAVPS